jgi:NAD(P)H dehydrogenase (quinone)
MAVQDENVIIGISGASGQLGRRVLELVVERVGASRVVAITRTPEKLAEFAAKGVDVRQGDFADKEGLERAFAGINRLLLISIDDTREGMRPRLHGNAINAAKQAGVQHIVYTSAIKPQHSPIVFLRDHAATEQLIADSGLAYTFLRNNFYLEVVLQSAAQAIATGSSFSATQGGAAAYVTRADCARVAAAVLTSSGHEGAIYDVTGSRAWTQEEITSEVSKVVGKTINYVPVSDDALRQGMVSNGVPPQLADFLVGIDRGLRLGALDVVSRTVERLTGTPPETLPEFLARHRETLLASHPA